MEIDQEQQYLSENEQKDGVPTATHQTDKISLTDQAEVVPGVQVVRSNTPRPLSLSESSQYIALHTGETSPSFPAQAPSAPPLPEELAEPDEEEDTDIHSSASIPAVRLQARPVEEPQEFLWLFEYGIEMDQAILNSPERLDGLALLYGPAVLKGYTLMVGAQSVQGQYGSTIATIVPDSRSGAEVWGVLYRIPQRVLEPLGEGEVSLLDTIHAAVWPRRIFHKIHVTVQEMYRERAILCITYAATQEGQQLLHLEAGPLWHHDVLFLQRLATIASKQKLPDQYIRQHLVSIKDEEPMQTDAQTMQTTSIPPSTLPDTHPGQSPVASSLSGELNTDRLPVFSNEVMVPQSAPFEEQQVRIKPLPTRSVVNSKLTLFSVYLVILLLLILVIAIFQGLGIGRRFFTLNVRPMGVPWQVIAYGLLGGCISSIVTLGRLRHENPPVFVVITWFTRPFIGATLAIFAYLLLTSGIFSLGERLQQQPTFFWLVGALAGLCEGWLFRRR